MTNNSTKETSVIRRLCGIAIKDCPDRTLLTNTFLDDRIITNILRRYYFSLLDVFCDIAHTSKYVIKVALFFTFIILLTNRQPRELINRVDNL